MLTAFRWPPAASTGPSAGASSGRKPWRSWPSTWRGTPASSVFVLGRRGRGFFVLSWNPWTLGSPVWQVCKESRRRMSARERITGPDIRSNSGTTTKEATSQLSSPILGTYWDSGPSTLHFGSLHAWSSVMKCRGHAPFAAWEAWMNCSMGPKFLGRGTVQTTPNAQRPLYLHHLHHS